MGAGSDNDIVYLATAPSEVEGMMWANAIRSEGISVLLRPGGPGAGAWASAATFEHVLSVREEDFAAAQEILERFLSGNQVSPGARGRRGSPTVRRRSLRKPG
jgi:hypothetical protein